MAFSKYSLVSPKCDSNDPRFRDVVGTPYWEKYKLIIEHRVKTGSIDLRKMVGGHGRFDELPDYAAA